MKIEWNDFKNFVGTKKISVSIYEHANAYRLTAVEGPIIRECSILKESPANADQADFETNYKTSYLALASVLQSLQVASSPPFGSKTLNINGVTKKLYARNTGFQSNLTIGLNTISYTCPFAWAKILGIEIVGGETLDTCDLKVFDTALGTYSGVPNYMLNQFGFTVNIAKDYYQKAAQFDADLYQGMIITLNYNSVSAKSIGVNLDILEVK